MVGALIRMRLRLLRNSLRAGTRAAGVIVGAVFGLLGGLLTAAVVGAGVPAGNSIEAEITVAAIAFGVWTLGWIVGPVVTGTSDETLQPEQFRLLPLRPQRLAAGLLVAAVVGIPPLVSLIAFAGLIVRGAMLGVAPALVAVAGVAGQLALVVTISRVVVGALGAALRSRRGRDLGVLLASGVALLVLPLQYLFTALGSAAVGEPPAAVSVIVRALPSGWAPLAVQVAEQGRWGLAAAALAGLFTLVLALGWAWSVLLARRMSAPPSASPQIKPGGTVRLGRLVPATPTGAVAAKELRTWWRDPRRRSALLVSFAIGTALLLPSFGGGAEAIGYLSLSVVAFCALSTGNLYGFDGSALWHTLVIPEATRADVRGRQWGWLLAVGPVAMLAAVVLPAVVNPAAYPWTLGLTPALLGAGAGVVLLQAVYVPYPLPEQRANPFAQGGNPGLAVALVGLAIGLLLAAAAVPVLAVLIAGALLGLPALSWLGVPLGIAVGVSAALWWGAIARNRLAERGPELLATVRATT